MKLTTIAKLALAITAIIACFLDQFNPFVLAGLLLGIACINLDHPLMLKNFFIVLTVLLFAVSGSYYFPNNQDLAVDMNLYLISFLLGYGVYKIMPKKDKIHGTEFFIRKSIKINVNLLRKGLIFLCLTKLMILAWDIMQYGLFEYYVGQAMVDNISSYGKKDTAKGISIIISSIISAITISTTALYVFSCHLKNLKVDFKVLTILLLILPLISLQRSAFAVGAMLLIAAFSFDPANRSKVYRVLTISFVSILFVGVAIGGVRENSLKKDDAALISVERIQTMIAGELSPIVAYKEIKDNIEILEYQLGKTILPPLIYKPIPRNFLPDKPLNSSGYYGEQLKPQDSANGFFLAPSIYGDMFLNFGIAGTMLFTAAFGVFAARMDHIYLFMETKYIPIFLIVYYNFYSIMRNNSVESITSILISMFCLTGIVITLSSVKQLVAQEWKNN